MKNRKSNALALPFLALFLAALLSACVSDGRSHVTSARERVYNPQTRDYEWYTPGQPPTSPGATSTSRQSYR